MSIVASQLIAEVKAVGDAEAKRKLLSVGETSNRVGAGIRTALGGALTLAGLAAVGAGVASLKMAGDFQSATTTLVTGAGEQQKNLEMIRKGILALGPVTGETTKQLVEGMFTIESSGQHGAKALETLKDAAEGAKVGGAELGAVANGVTTEMTDYASANLTAAQATNDLIATTAAGKTHLQDLATAMSTILPTSAAVHVSLTDVSGAMATMTGEGTNASSAATYLRQLLLALEAPASKGAAALKAIGLSAGQVALDMRKSLPATLQLITDRLAATYGEGSPKYVAALKDIAGGSRQMQGILELTGSHLATFKSNVLGIADAVKKGGSSITGWTLVQQNFNQKLDQAKSIAEGLGIKFGTALLPVIGQLFDGFSKNADVIGKMTDNIGPLVLNVEHAAETIGGMLLPPTLDLIKNFSTWVDTSGILTDSLHFLGDTVYTLAGILGPLIQDVSNLFKWLSQNQSASDALKDAILLLGGAFVGLKLVDTVAGFGQMFTKLKDVDGIARKLFPNIASIGSTAKTSAAEVTGAALTEEADMDAVDAKVKGVNADMVAMGPAAAEGGAAAKVGLAGLVDTLGTIAGFATLLALPFFTASPSTKAALFPDKKDQYPAPPGFWDFITHQGLTGNQTQDFSQVMGRPAKEAQDFASSIDKAWQDMEAIGAWGERHNHILGDLSDPLVLDKTDTKVMQIKEHLDDLGQPVVLKPLTPQVEAARLKVIDLKSHLDDLEKNRPLSIGTRSVDNAILKIMNLKDHIDDLPGVQIPGGGSFRGHASGILNNPVGHIGLVGERGPELMYVPQGASIFPNNVMPSMGQQTIIVQPNDIILDGWRLTQKMLPHIASALQYGVNSRVA